MSSPTIIQLLSTISFILVAGLFHTVFGYWANRRLFKGDHPVGTLGYYAKKFWFECFLILPVYVGVVIVLLLISITGLAVLYFVMFMIPIIGWIVLGKSVGLGWYTVKFLFLNLFMMLVSLGIGYVIMLPFQSLPT
jgi:hypothetical protein